MSVRFCGKCGAGWGADFNFCAKDGTPLNVAPVAHLGQVEASVEPVHEEPPVSKPTTGRKLVRKALPGRDAAPTQVEMKKAPEAESPRSPWGKVARAPAEAPAPGPIDMPDLDFGFDHHHVEPAPRIEGPATRGRRRPAKEAAVAPVAAPEVSRAIKEIAAEPVAEEQVESLRGEGNVESIFTAKKRRDAAAFSDTAWFRRPLETAEIDPVSGRVAHTESTYRPDPKVTMTQRRKFSLRRVGESV